MPSCISRRRGEQIEGGLQRRTMPSLLCWLIYDALSHHACLFLFASLHLEAELPMLQRHANAIRNGNARGDGNTRRDCRMKIEYRAALTVKHPKTLPLAPRSLRCFLNPLLILDLSTPALSRSF